MLHGERYSPAALRWAPSSESAGLYGDGIGTERLELFLYRNGRPVTDGNQHNHRSHPNENAKNSKRALYSIGSIRTRTRPHETKRDIETVRTRGPNASAQLVVPNPDVQVRIHRGLRR